MSSEQPRKLEFTWEGALADLKDQYSSVELQQKAMGWRLGMLGQLGVLGNFKESPWYPLGVSDRADELINELDETQIRQLYDELKSRSFGEWIDWLESGKVRGKIAEYDRLTCAKRKRYLQRRIDNEPLLLHHACIYIELWRQRCLFSFPPHTSLDTPESQRELLLIVATSHCTDHRDFWPFNHEEIEDNYPFRRNE